MGLKEEKVQTEETRPSTGRPVPSSISFVPGVAGLMIAGEVVKDLIGMRQKTDRK